MHKDKHGMFFIVRLCPPTNNKICTLSWFAIFAVFAAAIGHATPRQATPHRDTASRALLARAFRQPRLQPLLLVYGPRLPRNCGQSCLYRDHATAVVARRSAVH